MFNLGSRPQVGWTHFLLPSKFAEKNLFLTCTICSAKVISALLETSSSMVHKLVKKEVQPLVDDGLLKLAKWSPKAEWANDEDELLVKKI